MGGLLKRLSKNTAAQAEAAPLTGALGLVQHELQDVVTSLLLSETAYKAAEGPPAAAVAALISFQRQFPPGCAPLESIQFCRRRFLLAASPTTLFVAFMGTKQLRDVLADANLGTALLWAEAGVGAEAVSGAGAQASDSSSTPARAHSAAVTAAAAASAAAAAAADTPQAQAAAPGVHRGFLGRSRAVQVEHLWAHAQRQGLRLVLCGHSLGGAVAQLCTLRLLRLLRAAPPPADSLRCIVFGCPAIGNNALADHVWQQGWDAHFLSISLPEDVIPRLFLLAQAAAPPLGVAAATAGGQGQAADEQQAATQEQQQQQRRQDEQQQQQQGQQHEQQQPQQQGQGQGQLHHPEQPQNLNPSTDVDPASPEPLSPTRGGGPAGGWMDSMRAAALLVQKPLAATAGAAAGAARSARVGAGRLLPPALLPTFAHIGEQRHLLSHGLVPIRSSAGASAAAAAAAVAVAGATAVADAATPTNQAAQQEQQASQALGLQLLGLHSMQHYRSRAAAACWAALGGAAADRHRQEDAPVSLSHNLAPAMAVAAAVARLPVLPPPVVRQPQQQQQQKERVLLSVAVHGSGLESCTRALLALPASGATQLAATSLVNLARQRLLLDLQAGRSGSSSGSGGGLWSNTRSSRLLAAAAAAGRAATRGLGRLAPSPQVQQQQQQPPGAPPALLLRFAVPAAVLAQLQLQETDGGWRLPEGSLVLLSDFTRHSVAVQLQPQVVWMLGADQPLADAAFNQLKASAKAAAGPAAPRTWPFNPASLTTGLAAAAGAGLPWGRKVEGATLSSEEANHGMDAPTSSAPPVAAGGGASAVSIAAPAIQRRLASFGQRLVQLARAQLFGGEQQHPAPPAALLWGQLLLDATPAVWNGIRSNKSSGGAPSSSIGELVQQLEVAAAVVRWAGNRRHHSVKSGEEAGSVLDELEEVQDEEVAELQHLGLAARLRRSVVQASLAARRQVVLSGKWRGGLSGLPPPDLVVVVSSHRQLMSGEYGLGLEASVLAAVRRLTSACQAVVAPLLLAVGSHAPLSTPTRQQLAYSCGLVDGSGDDGSSRRGSVVPLLHQPPMLETVQVGALAAALHAFGVLYWQPEDTVLRSRL